MNQFTSRTLAFATGLFISTLVFLPFLPVWKTEPYTSVELISVEKKEGTVLVDTRFVKTDCEFQRMIVVGYSLNIPRSYPWVNTDGVTGNRIEGTQRLTVLVEIGEDRPESLEIRTRHLCDTEIVDKVFLNVEVPYARQDLE